MIRPPPRAHRTATLLPYTTLFRSVPARQQRTTARSGLFDRARLDRTKAADRLRQRRDLDRKAHARDIEPRQEFDLEQLLVLVDHGALHPALGEISEGDRKSTRLNSSHSCAYRMPSSACNTQP